MDDDDKKPEDAAAEPARDVGQDKGAQLREVSEDELKRIVDAHQTYFETSGIEGEKADLSRANLGMADLQRAFLTNADLQGANLCGASLEGAFLGGANFKGANLQGTFLTGADLHRADLSDADLQSANLSGANLQEADLSRASLQKAELSDTNLQGANLMFADLQGADLIRTDLQKADLSEAKLQGATLDGANLEMAELRCANLQEAHLDDANLQGANLRGANFRQAYLPNTTFEKRVASKDAKGREPEVELTAADLTGADLSDADLSDAKLSGVTGLLAHKLAGANLSNAKLPEDIAAFDGLARVEETSRIARPIFIGILVGCVYSWLTIATTTDARLLTNSASSPLPIIGTEIPIAGFYWVAPILLLGVYVYLHLYLQRLWEGLADLPAVFPDGKPLNKKVYPWLLSGLVRAHFKLLKDERTLLSRLENGAVIFLAWWTVPTTVLVFWGRYLPRHEWFGTGLHIVLLIVSIGSAILLHGHAAATLRRDVTAFRWRRPWSDRRTRQAAVALGLGAAFALVSLGAIEGEARWTPTGVALGAPATWVPAAFDLAGYRTNANLRDADVSTKPATWTGLANLVTEKWDQSVREKARAELAQVKGAPLWGTNLRDADAVGAFLAKADLTLADLQRIFLTNANLQGADLWGANLQGAFLYQADFKGARLEGTDFTNARGLTQDQLEGACGNDETRLPDYLADYRMKPCPAPAQSPSN